MALNIYVYRDAELGDCTNNGVSKFANKLCVTNASGPVDLDRDTDHYPLVRIAFGRAGNPILVPDGPGPDKTGNRCFGGNYASSSDSRFGEAIRKLAVDNGMSPAEARALAMGSILPIHDRFETVDMGG